MLESAAVIVSRLVCFENVLPDPTCLGMLYLHIHGEHYVGNICALVHCVDVVLD